MTAIGILAEHPGDRAKNNGLGQGDIDLQRVQLGDIDAHHALLQFVAVAG